MNLRVLILGWRGADRSANTPSPSRTACPRRILRGTMSGFVIRSLYTRTWNTWIEPSSDDDAKSGYVGWNATERRARAWYLSLSKSMSVPNVS